MPHGNNSSKRRVNAKKKGQRDRRAPLGVTTDNAQTSTSQPSSSAGVPSARNHVPEFPSFGASRIQEDQDGKRSRPFLSSSKESIYVRYKKSTQRFKDTLQATVPPELFQSDCASALVDATDYIVKEDIAVEGGLLSDLKLSIRVRKRIALEKYGGGDEGHSHFIEILEYCWSLLAPRRKTKQFSVVPPAPDDESVEPSMCNRFEKFGADDDETEDDTDDEADLPQTPLPRPKPSSPSQLTLQELLDGTDRTDCSLFLMTLDEAMKLCAWHFSKLNDSVGWVKAHKHSGSFLVGQVMRASVVTNLAIQQVESLEKEFNKDHPHLNTVYRVFINLTMVESVENLTRLVAKKSPIGSQFSEKHAIAFLGDAMENAFRNSMDAFKKRDAFVPNFLKRWRFRDADRSQNGELTVRDMFTGVQTMARMEAPVKFDQEDTELQHFIDFCGDDAMSHAWVSSKYIGSNRSITHTIRLLQILSEYMKENKKSMALKAGSFGTCLSARKKPPTRTQIDMDESLMGSIMPSLINSCRAGLMMKPLPHCNELLTGLVHIKTYVDHPERPVSWAVAFTVHAILTAILEVQGSDRFKLLATTARNAFEKFFSQVKWVKETRRLAIYRCTPRCDMNVEMMQYFALLAQTPTEDRNEALVSSWNPYCAGVFLSYIAYNANLCMGTDHVDSLFQLRITMHLFNALKQVGQIKHGQIELLDRIFSIFEGCKGIWDGPLPTKARLQTRWMTTFGYTCGLNRLLLRGPTQRNCSGKSTPLVLEQFSESFCRICLHDAHGFVDKVKRKRQKVPVLGPLDKLVARSNNTVIAMLDDEHLLATNLISLGFVLNQFTVTLFEELGWMPKLEQMARDNSPPDDVRALLKDGYTIDYLKYPGMIYLFPKEVLGPLDDGDAEVATRCAQILTKFFKGIPRDNVQWFAPYEHTSEA